MNRGRLGTCRRSCCWSPQGVCGKAGGCPCHVGESEVLTRREMKRKQAEMRHQEAVFAEQDKAIERVERSGMKWTR